LLNGIGHDDFQIGLGLIISLLTSLGITSSGTNKNSYKLRKII